MKNPDEEYDISLGDIDFFEFDDNDNGDDVDEDDDTDMEEDLEITLPFDMRTFVDDNDNADSWVQSLEEDIALDNDDVKNYFADDDYNLSVDSLSILESILNSQNDIESNTTTNGRLCTLPDISTERKLDFMHLRKRYSVDDQNTTNTSVLDMSSSIDGSEYSDANIINDSNYTYRNKLRSNRNHSQDIVDDMRDVSMVNIMESIKDLVCIMKSYINHTVKKERNELVLPTHKSLCLVCNILERFNQDLDGKKKCNLPCYAETIDTMFGIFTKIGSSPYTRFSSIFYMPSVDCMRKLLRYYFLIQFILYAFLRFYTNNF